MWENIVSELGTYDLLNWLALITGIFYGFLSMLNKPLCWVFGVISCSIIAFKDFTSYHLYFDGVLQIIYVILGLIGLLNWTLKRGGAGTPKIISLPWVSHLNAWLLGLLTSIVLVFSVQFFVNPAFAYLDSITTVFSVWATWLLIHRIYEHWLYWIVINALYIWIFYKSGADLFAVLYVFYLIIAIGGLFIWRKIQSKEIPYLDEV